MRPNTSKAVTIGQLLQEATNTLRAADIPSARLDCLLLIEQAVGRDRAHILAHPEGIVDPKHITTFQHLLAQRLGHTPLAYIRGYIEFYGRTFIIDSHVLVPRPETEAMIELLKQTVLTPKARIADIGTGSGCIGITASLELPGSIVCLSDIDREALQVAKRNVELHNVKVNLIQGDLLNFKHQPFELIMANLPYVPLGYPINKDAAFEPELALFAGKDGLDIYRQFWLQIQQLSYKPSNILTESLLEQHPQMAILALKAGYKLQQTQGLIQQFIDK